MATELQRVHELAGTLQARDILAAHMDRLLAVNPRDIQLLVTWNIGGNNQNSGLTLVDAAASQLWREIFKLALDLADTEVQLARDNLRAAQSTEPL